jgi:hypothetical protein
MATEAKKVRQARAFLQQRGIRTADMSPRQFAGAAGQLGKSFRDTLRMVAVLQMAGQGQGPAPIAREIARKR